MTESGYCSLAVMEGRGLIDDLDLDIVGMDDESLRVRYEFTASEQSVGGFTSTRRGIDTGLFAVTLLLAITMATGFPLAFFAAPHYWNRRKDK